MKSLFGLVVLTLVVVGTVRAQGDPLSGSWKINTSKSTAVSPMPKAETQMFEMSGAMERNVTDITGADGAVRKTEYSAKQNDGMWYPLKDSTTGQPTGGSVMIVKLDDWSTVRFTKRPNAAPGMALRVVARDGRTFIWTSIGMDGKVSGTYLFDKQ